MSLRRSPKAKVAKAAAKTPTTRARAKAPTRTPVPPVVTSVQLLTPSGTITLPWPAPGSKALATLQQHSIEWNHVIRNRTRWIRSKDRSADQDERARAFLHGIGIKEPQRRWLAEAGTVCVCIQYLSEQLGWEARILPWEFLISAGTRDLRTGVVVVTRWLTRSQAAGPPRLDTVLFVESAPGKLLQDWDFKSERRLVERYTKAKTFERLVSPTLDKLSMRIQDLKPGIVHLAGFDTHQGLELVKDPRASDIVDGYLLAAAGGVHPVSAAELARAVCSGAHKPTVVFCNIWNSAARVAPLLVAAGATSAIGFQDGMDDGLAEIFLGSFYERLGETQLVDAGFNAGWDALRAQPKLLRGTGIVLWRGGVSSQISLAGVQPSPPAPTQPPALLPSDTTAHQAQELIAFTVEPEVQFSYGLLHNNRDLFRRFIIRNLGTAPIHGLEVFVELHSNDGTYPYRLNVSLNGPVRDLTRDIRIALTSNLARTLDELLRTSLYVRVTWGPHEVFSQTFPVTLAPVDQWADTDADRCFLPSFVFPRDRAVASVIRNAEQFVTTLRDDPTAGFDGYQSLDASLADPAANVDHQVQALWYSVVYRVPASYINPPPTYAVASQRIRTPSEIVAGGYGTCIDLALMFAACLEAVEIYPVIFLLNDHAFPGYWRTDRARTSFLRAQEKLASVPDGAVDGALGDGSAASQRPDVAWSFDAEAIDLIVAAIKGNRLIPLESVGLTRRSSFADAIYEGREYFTVKERPRFLAMLDLKTAREQGVTPIPLGARLQLS